MNLTKQQKQVIAIVLASFVLIGIGAVIYFVTRPTTPVADTTQTTKSAGVGTPNLNGYEEDSLTL